MDVRLEQKDATPDKDSIFTKEDKSIDSILLQQENKFIGDNLFVFIFFEKMTEGRARQLSNVP